MLITFDPSKLRFEKVKIKTATTALGGSIRVLDEKAFEKTGKESFIRYDAPMAVVRDFLVRNHYPKFLHPAEASLTFYEDRILTIELAPRTQNNERVTEGLFGEREWISQAEVNWQTARRPEMSDGLWYFDGVYAYTFNNPNLRNVIEQSIPLSDNNMFRETQVFALNLTRLNAGAYTLAKSKKKKRAIEDQFELEERSAIAFVCGEDYVISPPIWRTLGSEKWTSTRNKAIDEREDGIFDSSAAFDSIDQKFFVSLSFVLAAGADIAREFGYEAIAPLQLPKLMIQLKTVNLPNVAKEIKNTFDAGITFSQAMAWLLGLLYRASTNDQVFAVRRMMKYLSTRGIYLRSKLKATNITQNEHLTDNGKIPLVSAKEALKRVNDMTAEQWSTLTESTMYRNRIVDVLSFEG